MKKISLLLSLLMLLTACRSSAVFDDNNGNSSKNLTAPPASLAERKPLVNPKNDKPFEEPTASAENSSSVSDEIKANIDRKTTTSKPADTTFHFDAAYLQRLYPVLVSRTTNKMLKSTSAIYNAKGASTPTMYVSYPENENPSVGLPNLEYASEIAKDIITSAQSYLLVDSKQSAGYVLDISLAQNENYDHSRPILSCRMVLKNANNQQVGTWVESLSPVSNDDQSWW